MKKSRPTTPSKIVYRGVKDILPSQVDHYFICDDGVWGQGTYFSKSLENAKWYGHKNFDVFGLVFEYRISGRILIFQAGLHFEPKHPTESLITLTKAGKEALGTTDLKIEANLITSIACAMGYDGIEILDIGKTKEDMTVLFPTAKLIPMSVIYRGMPKDEEERFSFNDLSALEKRIKLDLKTWQHQLDDTASES